MQQDRLQWPIHQFYIVKEIISELRTVAPSLLTKVLYRLYQIKSAFSEPYYVIR